MDHQKHVHLIGICGTAMASLAGLLQQRGHTVTGSDNGAYPPMSNLLASLGIELKQPFSEANLEPRPDLVIVGNAISRGNIELEYVLDKRIPLQSMAATIHDEFLRDRESIVVAGTHGKTTVTSMLAWIYETASKAQPEFQPSFLIGGVAENFGTSFALRDSRPFLLEGDEYDTAFFDKGPKFLHYFPDAVILTHVEFDHADIYRDLEDVKTAFKRLINLVPRRGKTVAFDASANVDECLSRALCSVERYGFSARAKWRLTEYSQQAELATWTVLQDGEPWAEFTMPLAGEHNALNATAAAALAFGQGIHLDSIVQALRTFRSVKRRLEVRAEIGGVTFIDDFAHHPTAIRETLRALRSRYAGRRLIAVLEPRSNTLRRNVFEEELVESLRLADEVVLAEVFQAANIPPSQLLHPENVVAHLRERGTPARLMRDADAIAAALSPDLRQGDVVAILSNGGFGNIYEKLPNAFRQQLTTSERTETLA